MNPRLAAAAALMLASLSFFASVVLWVRSDDRDQAVATANIERRDQNCRLFEGDHLDEVTQLRQTYRYLSDLPAKQRGDFINRYVAQNLPELERRAQIDSAPEYCDEPGVKAEGLGRPPVGLPEPDPVVPERPPDLKIP